MSLLWKWNSRLTGVYEIVSFLAFLCKFSFRHFPKKLDGLALVSKYYENLKSFQSFIVFTPQFPHWFDGGGRKGLWDTSCLATAASRSPSFPILNHFLPRGTQQLVKFIRLLWFSYQRQKSTGTPSYAQMSASIIFLLFVSLYVHFSSTLFQLLYGPLTWIKICLWSSVIAIQWPWIPPDRIARLSHYAKWCF